MKIQFENMRGNASPGQGTDAPAVIARRGQLPRNYKSFASAALDPHPTVHNPLLPFGKFTQAVIDGLAVFACLVLVCATGVGLAAAIFFLFFCSF